MVHSPNLYFQPLPLIILLLALLFPLLLFAALFHFFAFLLPPPATALVRTYLPYLNRQCLCIPSLHPAVWTLAFPTPPAPQAWVAEGEKKRHGLLLYLLPSFSLLFVPFSPGPCASGVSHCKHFIVLAPGNHLLNKLQTVQWCVQCISHGNKSTFVTST